MKMLKSFLGAALVGLSIPSSALTIVNDFSNVQSVFQDAAGQLFGTAGAGRNDVTALFQANIVAASNYWMAAVGVDFTHTITFKLGDLTSENAVGISQNTGVDANQRPSSSILTVDSGPSRFFIDPTPYDNSEFAMTSKSSPLGGGSVNVSRFGQAVPDGPADTGANDRNDLLSLLLHEEEHSLGFSNGLTRFTDRFDANKNLIIAASVTGLNDFSIPLSGVGGGGSHINGDVQNGLFNDTAIAVPGFGPEQRTLLTAIDIYAICTVNGCAANQVNSNPMPVPEPTTWLMLSLGLAGLAGASRLRNRGASV